MTLSELRWLPKPTTPGDLEGGGTKRLLGQPNLGRLELLIRETAQNSWDARLPETVPVFDVRFRQVDQTQRKALRSLVFTGSSPELGLDASLQRQDLQVIEIHDRNTRGLGGPVRNDIEVPAGEDRNFVDFVLNVGSGRVNSEKGGTYGFGKTAAYLASSCTTILIWTRTRNSAGDLEHRLIASAIGNGFVENGRQYTGRQWWGDPSGSPDNLGFTVSPVTGAAAQNLGELLFERHFDGDESGTSIMIIDPVEEIAEQGIHEVLPQIVINNLWPKLVDDQSQQWRMKIELHGPDGPISLDKYLDDDVLLLKGMALEAIRKRQSGETSDEDPLIVVHDIHCYRPARLVGHLALALLPGSSASSVKHLSDGERDRVGLNGLTTMRHSAELVVRTESFGQRAGKPHNWVGIFKPTADTDRYFAMSEPPAHDSWNPNGPGLSDERHGKRFVNVGLRRIREAIQAFIAPSTISLGDEQGVSTATLAASLAGLTGAVGPGALVGTESNSSSQPSGPKSSGLKRPRVQTTSTELRPIKADQSRQWADLILQTDGPPGDLIVNAERLSLAVDGSSIADNQAVRVEEWHVGPVRLPSENGTVTVSAGSQIRAVVSFPRGLAIDIRFRAREGTS